VLKRASQLPHAQQGCSARAAGLAQGCCFGALASSRRHGWQRAAPEAVCKAGPHVQVLEAGKVCWHALEHRQLAATLG
jgi:hypothetical protein